MSQKKPISKVVVGVSVLCVVLLMALFAIYLNYNSMLRNKDSEILSLKSQLADAGVQPNPNQNITPDTSDKDAIIADLQNQVADLQQQKESLSSQISQKNTEIDRLNGVISQKNSEISQKNSDISNLNSQIAQKNSEISSLESQINSLNSQVASLESQIEDLEAAKVIKVGLVGTDERPFLQTPYLHVEGFICNVGKDTAYNVRIHVVAYQGGVVAIDTYINKASLSGEYWSAVNENIYYEFASPELTSWTITPEWT